MTPDRCLTLPGKAWSAASGQGDGAVFHRAYAGCAGRHPHRQRVTGRARQAGQGFKGDARPLRGHREWTARVPAARPGPDGVGTAKPAGCRCRPATAMYCTVGTAQNAQLSPFDPYRPTATTHLAPSSSRWLACSDPRAGRGVPITTTPPAQSATKPFT
jgi:hypothetical protein